VIIITLQGNASGIQQTGEMMVHENTWDTLWKLQIPLCLSDFQLSLCVNAAM